MLNKTLVQIYVQQGFSTNFVSRYGVKLGSYGLSFYSTGILMILLQISMKPKLSPVVFGDIHVYSYINLDLCVKFNFCCFTLFFYYLFFIICAIAIYCKRVKKINDLYFYSIMP